MAKFAQSDKISCCEFITISSLGDAIKKILCVVVGLQSGD
eukprot:CAMPEP_0206203626 /NCGR_PEP_ID=MMETSP0166-20121206/12969_1 /ASSEMBLY_ACC=CAM_ASM_000260 /TAXON_ID=95228 /ORGANISM="Vannella robusta, Strain DIVA3 518/3/11/1/6" /LENGTH=39 /DNA_ID= /DNA_START= /DNA_END= /DNA_ORIENTATION=